jgi:hypothetical protein
VAAEAQQAAAAASELQQPMMEVEPQQAAAVTTATTVVVIAAPPTSPAPAVAGSLRAAVVEIPDDDDILPPCWDQWASAPASAPEASAGALLARGDVGATLGCPADGAGASSSPAGPAARLEEGREDADAPPAHFIEAQAEQGLWQELRDHGASLNRALNEALRIHRGPAWRVFQVSWVSWGFKIPSLTFICVRAFFGARSSRLACWWLELDSRARERYDALDRLDADLQWYRGQNEALDALVEALRPLDRWLAYRAEALLDLPPEQGAQAAEGASVVERVRTALLERDDALCRAREDLEGARSLSSTWEAEVSTVRIQLQQGRVALEETEGLKTALVDKAAALTTAEEQLRQDRAARQEAEGQLQRERAALVEARAALEQGHVAREEALGQLHLERAALEEARATLKKQEEEVSRLNGELVQISISHEDQRQSLEEQEASYLKLQREAEETRQSLEVEKKQVKDKFAFARLSLIDSFFWDPLPTSSLFMAFRPADCSGARDHPGRDCERGLQLLGTGVGGAAGRRPRDLPGGRGRRSASWELAGESLACPLRTCLEADAPRPSSGRPEGPRRSGVPLPGGLRGRGVGLRRPGRR